jgi:hypothetical protein
MKRIKETEARNRPRHEETNTKNSKIMSDPLSDLIDPFVQRHMLLPLRQANRAWRQGQRVPCEENLQEADRLKKCDDVY